MVQEPITVLVKEKILILVAKTKTAQEERVIIHTGKRKTRS
jgi:hypothetical protein